MALLQQLILYATLVLLLGVLVGLVRRRRFTACYSFTAYVTYTLVWGSLIMTWPRVFYTSGSWAIGQIIENLLLLGVGLELGYRVFRAFPGARQSAGMLLLVVFVSVALTVLTTPAPLSHPGGPAWILLALWVVPRLSTGVAWLLTAIGAVVLWYRLPIGAFEKAILVGLIPYLLIFTIALSVSRSFGFGIGPYATYAHTTAYLVLVGYWTHLVWRARKEHAAAATSGH
jgi:hypothetical protein